MAAEEAGESSPLFERLRRIVEPYREQVVVKTDEPGHCYLEVDRGPKPELFSAVMQKKNGVSFHYYPVYADPSLLDDVSPDLERRMQGKSCFTFKRADDPAIDELEALVRSSAEAFLDRARD